MGDDGSGQVISCCVYLWDDKTIGTVHDGQ